MTIKVFLTPVTLGLVGLCGVATAQTQPANPPSAPRGVMQAESPSQGMPNPAAVVIGRQAAQAPWFVGVQQSLTRESNHRFNPSAFGRRSNNVSATTLRGGLNQRLSRQRFFADAEVRHTRYSNESSLNNTGFALNAGIDFATVGRIGGTLSGHATRAQTSFFDFNPQLSGTAGADANTEDARELRGTMRIGGTTRLTFELGGDVRQVRQSAAPSLDFDRVGARTAVLYRLGASTTLGLGLATAKTDFANGDTGKRNDVYGQLGWSPSFSNDLQLRLAQTKSTRTINSELNFTGLTGSLVWNWRPTARMALSSYAARDAGQEVGFLRLTPERSITGIDVGQLSNLFGSRLAYEVTSKVTADANVAFTQRRSVNAFTSAINSRTENTLFALGLRWLPTRNLSFGCNVGREQQDRKVNNNGSVFDTRAFNDVAGCFGAFTIY